jgi:hypothetical protein
MTARTKAKTSTRYAKGRVALLAILIAAGLATHPARADEGPVVLGHPQRPPILTLDPFSGSLGLMGILEYDNSKSKNSSTSSNSALLQETATVATGGGVVSRNFLEWHGNLTLGLDENWSNSPSQNAFNYATATAYNFDATLLGSTILPSNYYARRIESYIAPAFQPFIKDIHSEYGANIDYRSPVIPTSLSLSHTETTQSTVSNQPQFTLTQDQLNFQTAYEPIEHQHLDLNYQYSLVGQSNPGLVPGLGLGPGLAPGLTANSDYATQSAALNHVWQIDSAGRYVLAENVSYSTQDGNFPFSHLRFNEDLHMHHTDTFETELQYTYDQQNYLSSSTTSQQILGTFTHHLFESLSTHGQAGATFNDNSFATTSFTPANDSTTDSYFANINWEYTKKVPMGIFGADLALGYNQTNNGAIGTVQPIVNNFQTFTDPQPIIITRANVDPKSIAIFNAAGTRRYVLNTDYTVTRVGNTLQIDRVFTSAINPGDTVLLDYNVNPLPGYSATTTNLSAGAHYDITEGFFNGLSVFGQYGQQNQTTSSNVIPADNVVDTMFGAEYRIWKLTLRADHENRDSTLASFVATRFSAHVADRITQHTSYSVGATQAFLEYPDVGGNSSLTTVDGHIDYQINRGLEAIGTILWRNNEDSRFGNMMGLEEQGELRWTIRQTQIYFMVRHTDLEASSNTTDNLSVQFGITRNF